jgi:hypothetical protein
MEAGANYNLQQKYAFFAFLAANKIISKWTGVTWFQKPPQYNVAGVFLWLMKSEHVVDMLAREIFWFLS